MTSIVKTFYPMIHKLYFKETGKTKVVVNKIKGEFLKTKWKRDALRNLKIKKSLKKLSNTSSKTRDPKRLGRCNVIAVLVIIFLL